MSVGDICTRHVVSASREVSVFDAAVLMRLEQVGSVIIVDERDGNVVPLGIITDRDITVEVTARGLDPKVIKLGDLAFEFIATIDEDASFAEAASSMATHGVRRLPVIDVNGVLVGILTMDDLLCHLVAPLSSLSGAVMRERRKAAVKRP